MVPLRQYFCIILFVLFVFKYFIKLNVEFFLNVDFWHPWEFKSLGCNLICLYHITYTNVTANIISATLSSLPFEVNSSRSGDNEWQNQLLFLVLRIHLQSVGCPVYYWIHVLLFVPFRFEASFAGAKIVGQGTRRCDRYKRKNRDL